MILTVTPNPSIDRTVTVPALRPGDVHRAVFTRVDAGGKGVNVSRALARHGLSTRAALPLGGDSGKLMSDLLDGTGVDLIALPSAGEIRTNIAVVERDGTTTKVNEAGPRYDLRRTESFIDTLMGACTASTTWFTCCGSLPPGMPATIYAELTEQARSRGVRVAVDASGEALRQVIDAAPDLLKPNRAELAELMDADLPTVGDVVDAARELVDRGVGRVLVSLGRDGALLVGGRQSCYAYASATRPLSTVGAGDCSLAGYLSGVVCGQAPEDALATAVAFGTAAVMCPGTEVPGPAEVASVPVTVQEVPCRDRPLDD
ncbi:fructose-1-phosphate kinase [Austwickia chelonae]|uniref:1-phosphofructokinase n=1 Tax=Austwickia chelonae NBRC 105200 TaxID=1184607 RepID=K6W700_9MICO|nr:1-phosphofructokinase [Austwickia chelonae]GAB77602.1 1-phosphofructokinase [Austwickia chelonae NBRC 105200]SEW13857.1 fructose-1-phosphate kinase [Austwickia chelonae]